MNKWKKWQDWPIKIIIKKDFPRQLKEIKNCPKKLFYRGDWDNNIFEKSLAVVGSRRMSRYGREVVTKFMPELIANKISIISGFMYGVDTESHRKCLEFGGKTIAVLGGGLDILVPPENNNLYSDILENNGLLISEYKADFQPTLWSFPQRNRIVAGLSSLGILVIEAGIKSGSLITARMGREQNKNVFVIPGQINNSIAEGCNYLIKNNLGKMTLSVEEIIGSHKILQENLFESLDPLENEIIKLLKIESLSVDELCKKLTKSVVETEIKIGMMSLQNIIFEENGKIYLKN
ncbi:MAG: DNA-processing protein DprA [Candidatus Shapirobacteria bacterium]|nr:DNA-processing protein DprA [Candidatus Shapirobacteria bacterium]